MNKYLLSHLYCLERDNSVVFGPPVIQSAVGHLLACISLSKVLGGHNNLACFV